ncbi:hypothetical protein GC197_13065 [bacterium]|nr:hypothetical protein [bacterium]
MTDSDDPFLFEDEPKPEEKKVDPSVTISLMDLLVAVTITAALCVNLSKINGIPLFPWLRPVMIASWAIPATIGGTALFLFGRRWFFRRPTDFQPGHWLLCVVGITFVWQVFIVVAKIGWHQLADMTP